MGRKRKQSIIAHLKEKILGPKPKSKWDTVSPEVPYTGDESAEEALENELAHELGVAFDVYGRVNQILVVVFLFSLDQQLRGGCVSLFRGSQDQVDQFMSSVSESPVPPNVHVELGN